MDLRKVITIGVLLFFIIFSACVLLFPEKESAEQSDLCVPDDAYLILHLSTNTLPYGINDDPCSYILYYDENGKLIKSHKEYEEVIGDFMVSSDTADFYFLRNETVVAMKEEIRQAVSSDISIDTINFGPSQVGFIEQYGTAYALMNVGTQNGQYINILRFSSGAESYDVIIPHYLEHVCYDEEQGKFICVISPANSDYQGHAVEYVTVSYDYQTSRFRLQDGVKSIDDTSYMLDTMLYRYSMIKNNWLYMTVLSTLGDNKGRLILNIYDVNDGVLLESKILMDAYDLGKLGHGLLTGSSSLPICERNGKLYIFTSQNSVITIGDSHDISTQSMPFAFENAYSIYSLDKEPEQLRDSFWGSKISVDEEGTIYILNVFEDRKVQIHRLENEVYELVYEIEIPENIPDSLIISSFLFVGQN